MKTDRLDHLVLNVQNIEATSDFYLRLLGMKVVISGEDRPALVFRSPKINLYEADKEFESRAHRPMPGSTDLYFIKVLPVYQVMQHLRAQHIEILAEPISRMEAVRPIESIYFRDPDLNLIDISSRLDGDAK